jgi:hypothetical protein
MTTDHEKEKQYLGRCIAAIKWLPQSQISLGSVDSDDKTFKVYNSKFRFNSKWFENKIQLCNDKQYKCLVKSCQKEFILTVRECSILFFLLSNKYNM